MKNEKANEKRFPQYNKSAVNPKDMLNTIPDEISFSESLLTIRWKDGKECQWNLLMLRRNCPCAQCRGGHESNSIRTTGHIQKIQLLSFKKIGRYALQLNWSDNHDLGMYTYDQLRESCETGSEYQLPHDRL